MIQMTAMRLALAAGIFVFTFAATAQAGYIGPPKTTPAPQAAVPQTQTSPPQSQTAAPQTQTAAPPAAQPTPPVFKDAGVAPTTPPQLPAGAPGDAAAPAATAAAPAVEPVPVPVDPCEGSMSNIDAYTACQDMMQKIERMKKGNASRREAYYPKPPPEVKKPEPAPVADATKPVVEGAKKEEPKTDAAATTAAAPVPESTPPPKVIGNK